MYRLLMWKKWSKKIIIWFVLRNIYKSMSIQDVLANHGFVWLRCKLNPKRYFNSLIYHH